MQFARKRDLRNEALSINSETVLSAAQPCQSNPHNSRAEHLNPKGKVNGDPGAGKRAQGVAANQMLDRFAERITSVGKMLEKADESGYNKSHRLNKIENA